MLDTRAMRAAAAAQNFIAAAVWAGAPAAPASGPLAGVIVFVLGDNGVLCLLVPHFRHRVCTRSRAACAGRRVRRGVAQDGAALPVWELDRWVDLRLGVGGGLAVEGDAEGCTLVVTGLDGLVRLFDGKQLKLICKLPRPHTLVLRWLSGWPSGHALATADGTRRT